MSGSAAIPRVDGPLGSSTSQPDDEQCQLRIGTREQEKRRQLVKNFYVAFGREEDDETRFSRLAKMLPATYREEPTSAGSQASNRQGNGNGWDYPRKVGPEDQRYVPKGMEMRLNRTKGGYEIRWARGKRSTVTGVIYQIGLVAMRHRVSSAVTLVYTGSCPGKDISEVAVPPQAYQES